MSMNGSAKNKEKHQSLKVVMAESLKLLGTPNGKSDIQRHFGLKKGKGME